MDKASLKIIYCTFCKKKTFFQRFNFKIRKFEWHKQNHNIIFDIVIEEKRVYFFFVMIKKIKIFFSNFFPPFFDRQT